MKVLIAPDSFKDSLKAIEVAQALGRGLRKIMPDIKIRMLPMADGGEGTVESVIDATDGRIIPVSVKDPLMRDISSFFGISGDGSMAVIEMAAASGLEILEESERNPWLTSTFGTGELLSKALDMGCRKILMGIGGSATNDGGMGMATALGAGFLDADGKQLFHGGGALVDLQQIDIEGLDPRIRQTEILVACDVSNPLTGTRGASFVYGPQKGADPEMVKKLDNNLAHLARVISTQLGREVDTVPGAGAAGGLGAGLMAFLGARLMGGFDMVAESVKLEEALSWSDLVITGEGRMDSQTKFGKTPFGVAGMARKYEKRVIGVAGTVEEDADELYEKGFDLILPILEKPMDLPTAIKDAQVLLERTGERIARILKMRP